MRFLTALVSLGKGRYRLDGVPRMRETAHRGSARRRSINSVSAPTPRTRTAVRPWSSRAAPGAGGRVGIKGDVSSQFLSGLHGAPFAPCNDDVEVAGGLVSVPMWEMTSG